MRRFLLLALFLVTAFSPVGGAFASLTDKAGVETGPVTCVRDARGRVTSIANSPALSVQLVLKRYIDELRF